MRHILFEKWPLTFATDSRSALVFCTLSSCFIALVRGKVPVLEDLSYWGIYLLVKLVIHSET